MSQALKRIFQALGYTFQGLGHKNNNYSKTFSMCCEEFSVMLFEIKRKY
jgi:hypothetical protein